jgi:hypothetical protein
MGCAEGGQHDEDEGDRDQAGGEAYNEEGSADGFQIGNEMGMEGGAGEVEGGEKLDGLFHVVELACAGEEELVAPGDAHPEEEKALEVAAKTDGQGTDPGDETEEGVFKHRASSFFYKDGLKLVLKQGDGMLVPLCKNFVHFLYKS